MIYISSSCAKYNKIKDSVQKLVDNGFRNIELSGGTEHYDGLLDDLLNLKEKYDLNYLCHNYFPPPKEHFVLNLASLDDRVYQKTIDHLLKTIELSKKLGAKKLGFHAGFFVDIKISEIGKKITQNNLFDKEKSIQKFCDGFKELQKTTGDLKLYIENNVLSTPNNNTYNGEQFLMLCNSQDYLELKTKINFELLLDVAHLKVSSKTLDLDFVKELSFLAEEADYIHISDNDSYHDQNNQLKSDSYLTKTLKEQNLKNKTYTIEVYNGIESIKETYDVLNELIR